MALFRIWAPYSTAVDIALGDDVRERVPMAETGNGWWEMDVPYSPEGTSYAFVLDGSEPLPDPRSPWQPRGVFGPSHTVNHAAFDWHDAGWQAPPLKSAVIYELHVGTFTHEGTFEAIIAHLDHLRELGVTHIELMPVNEFPGGRGWGYDGVDLYAPFSGYGGPESLKRLVDTCHTRGLALLLDVVYNHLGPSGNFLGRFGPYFTDRYKTPWGLAVNLDGPGSDEVRRFFCDNALMWLRDYHFDGLRVDAVHAIVDTSAVHFLEQLAREVDVLSAQTGRHLVLVAESDLNDPRIVRSRDCGGYGLDAQWSDDFHHAVHAALTGERDGYYADFGALSDVAYALEHAYVYDGRYSDFRKRRHGRATTGLAGWRFVGYLQNHDQIGNRARGERSAALMPIRRLKVAAALVCLSPFVPMLFQGEEWGATSPFQYFTDHQDAELGLAVSEGRRSEFAAFGWDPAQVPDPQDVATFERSRLDWSEVEREPHASLYDWYRQLLRLRKFVPALSNGRLDHVRVTYDERKRWLVMRRDSVCVACNLGGSTQPVPLPAFASVHVLLASEPLDVPGINGLEMPPDSVAVIAAG